MTSYERLRLSLQPFLPALEGIVRQTAKNLIIQENGKVSILDIGGRKSPASVGLPAEITILDLPRQNGFQHQLNLGISETILTDIKQSRSNVVNIVLEDMTACSLPSSSFNGVMCVEVIEHVREDHEFVMQIHRVLKPGGWVVLTTPNGEYIKNSGSSYNPDHVRHYTRSELTGLLSRFFGEIEVQYVVKTNRYYLRGLRSIDFKKPAMTLMTLFSNFINTIQSSGPCTGPIGAAKLLAVARKTK